MSPLPQAKVLINATGVGAECEFWKIRQCSSVHSFFGEGVRMFGLSKKERLRRAAERGHAESQMWLGYAYQVGQGVQRDYAKAMKWYRLAAAQGHAASQCNLGVMYQNGEGVQQDYQEKQRAGFTAPLYKGTLPLSSIWRAYTE
jgi:hypothetical protein